MTEGDDTENPAKQETIVYCRHIDSLQEAWNFLLKRIRNMKYLVYSLIVFICACADKKGSDIDGAFFTSWIKGIVTDSIISETGSLLAAPFSKRSNSLPDIIYLSSRRIYTGSRDSNIRSMFDVKDSLVVQELPGKEIDILEEQQLVSRDSSVFKSTSVNVLGTIYINQILSNPLNTIIYIDHSYSGKITNHYFSAISELRYSNGRWVLIRTEVYEMS